MRKILASLIFLTAYHKRASQASIALGGFALAASIVCHLFAVPIRPYSSQPNAKTDIPYLAGHWAPYMLYQARGGRAVILESGNWTATGTILDDGWLTLIWTRVGDLEDIAVGVLRLVAPGELRGKWGWVSAGVVIRGSSLEGPCYEDSLWKSE